MERSASRCIGGYGADTDGNPQVEWYIVSNSISWSPMGIERSNDLTRSKKRGTKKGIWESLAGSTVTPPKGWRKWRRREVSLTAITQ